VVAREAGNRGAGKVRLRGSYVRKAPLPEADRLEDRVRPFHKNMGESTAGKEGTALQETTAFPHAAC
jgi:hypothetical protein